MGYRVYIEYIDVYKRQVEASRNVSIDVQDDGLGTAICPKCKTKYDLSRDGVDVYKRQGYYQ